MNYAKLISGVLRYRMPIENVIKLVNSLQLESENINTWKVGVSRALKKYVVDGTEAKGQNVRTVATSRWFTKKVVLSANIVALAVVDRNINEH